MFLTKQARLFALSLVIVSCVPALTQCMNPNEMTNEQVAQLSGKLTMQRNIERMQFDANNPKFKMTQDYQKSDSYVVGFCGGVAGFVIGCALARNYRKVDPNNLLIVFDVDRANRVLASSVSAGAALGAALPFLLTHRTRKLHTKAKGLNVHGAAASDDVDALNAHREFDPASLHAPLWENNGIYQGNHVWKSKGQTPLMYATANKADHTAEIIINSVPAQTLTLQDISKRSALDYARHLGLNAMVTKIEQKAAQAN